MDTQTKTLTIFAPAKINLYLHVTGRLDNGYHTLDSLVAFSDIGDKCTHNADQKFTLGVRAWRRIFRRRRHVMGAIRMVEYAA